MVIDSEEAIGNVDAGNRNTEDSDRGQTPDGEEDDGMTIYEHLVLMSKKEKKNKCKDYLCYPAEMDGTPSVPKAVFQSVIWSTIALVSIGFVSYYRFGDPDEVGDSTCRYMDLEHGHGTNIGLRFGLLMLSYLAMSFTLLLSRILSLISVVMAVSKKAEGPARKSKVGRASCWLPWISILGGCFVYYVYGNGIITSEPARVCTAHHSKEGTDPYPGSKLYRKTGVFLRWYSLSVQLAFLLFIALWGLYFFCLWCRGVTSEAPEDPSQERNKQTRLSEHWNRDLNTGNDTDLR